MLSLPVFGYVIWNLSATPQTLSTLDTYQEAGKGVKQDFQSLPSLPLTQTDESYQIQDDTTDGIDIQFANQTESLTQEEEKKGLNLSFPKDYSKPIDIKLDAERSIHITDLGGKDDYTVDTLEEETPELEGETSFWQRLFLKQQEEKQSYLRYTSKDQRKSLLYAYQKDQATGEKKLKHWTLYKAGDGIEHEEYQIDNAKVKVNEEGIAEVFYYGDKDIKNEQVAAEVDSNLMERAQRTLEKEMGEDLLNGNKTPDFTIPKPYYIDREGNKHEAEWKWHEETKSLSVNFTPESYPVALDPTLSFTAPGMSNSGDVITGEASSAFGSAFASGDWNSDGKMDLVVGAYNYSSITGRVYLFYNDGGIATNASKADVIITGAATGDYFGNSITAGDFNTDGRTDLVVGADGHGSGVGRAYIFYNDGSIPTTAATADVTITGETTSNLFGRSFTSGDFNSDGTTDLVVGAYGYSTSTGRAYIFYNDGSIPTTAATADVTITGETTNNYFGYALISGDFNADGRTDFAVSGYRYSTYTGRAYIFHNDGSIPTTAATADVTITGEATSNYFGYALTAGDLNADGKTDLVVGAYNASGTGRAYIFHNDGSIPTTAATADVSIAGVGTVFFGVSLTTNDFNADGRTDLAVANAPNGSSVYIFYNDGSIPTTTNTADVAITGEATSDFGYAIISGDFNADGKADLVIGAYSYSSSAGRVYLFYSQNGQVNTNQSIIGEATGDQLGEAMATGDWNSDGRTDLAVGAPDYSASTGRVYVFYGDGQIPSTAATADVTITGEAASNFFGVALTAGDLNADGKTDLVVGAHGYSTNTGRAYIFYGDGSIPTTAATADVTITGGATSNSFGYSLAAGDLNADGKTDLVVGAISYSTNTGRAYIFYNGSIITEDVSGADVTITGGATSNSFGYSLAAGDFNADGEVDLAVGAYGYNPGSAANTGRAYIFHNDGSIPTTAATADITITGQATNNLFGIALAAGDLNADGKTDLAVGAYGYSSFTGRAYIFHNDGSIPTTAATADVTITGGATNDAFGIIMTAGDLNTDGKTDLIVGASEYSSTTGRAYIYYNDGSIPTTAATADVTLTGEAVSNSFSIAMTIGDMNGDGRTDLIVGANGNTSDTGEVYIYETRENFAWKLQKQVGSTLRTGLDTSGQELKITGETSSSFGISMTTGDLNSDGKLDLIVGASGYVSNTGRMYVFYSDGSLVTGATSADVVITGSGTAYFGYAVATGDINNDSRIDLIVGAYGTSSNTGKIFVFYNDGTFPGSSAAADLAITGEANSYFGSSLVTGDFNADGWTDLAVGAHLYNANWTGRVYVFYGDSAIPTTAATADVTISGEAANNRLGSALAAGDLNADGKTDLVAGALEYSASAFTGRVYIFYNGSIITENASGADIIITGEGANYNFGRSIVVGDFNFDGKVDLAAGATGYASGAGRAYIFYNGSIITENSSAADVIISGQAGSSFGISVAAGDFNADGRTDLAVGGYAYSTSTGRAYLFYNDGSIPTTAATADMTLTGEATSDSFGISLTSGDFNADGKADLAVGAFGYSSSKGRVYIYTFGNDQVITGEADNNYFGTTVTTGDLNADGKTDLVVGAYGYSTATGRAYIFYNDGAFASTAATADVIITGETTNNNFGAALSIGDFNADGKTDLAVGANRYSTYTGRAYLFYADGTNNFGTTTCSGTPAACSASDADVIITGSANSSFGSNLAAGDVNTSGTTDLIVSTNSGWSYADVAYIFYNDGSIPTTAGTADVTITGTAGSYFSIDLAVGDFNTDGRMDLAIGDNSKAYIFHNDGSIPTTSATADVTITGDASTSFGNALASGDFNADGRTDLAVGAYTYSTATGRAYIFYNDGSIPTTAATADVTITGETTNNYFGIVLAAGDMNADGKTDLVVSAYRYSTFTGRVYVFHNDGSYPTAASTADAVTTGASAAGSPSFGVDLALGDLNADGLMDLAVGANHSQAIDSSGKAYILSSEAAVADVSNEPLKTRGTMKTRGTLKIR